MKHLRVQRSALPSRWALIVLALCVAASMFINYRASAQNTPAPGTTAADKPPADSKPAAAKPADAKAEQNTGGTAEPAAKPGETSKRPAASKAEDSATIQDDPTLVPDDKESADNNITFPIDI
jgi:hypothetical protein